MRLDRVLAVSSMLLFMIPGCFGSRKVEEERQNPAGDTAYNIQGGYAGDDDSSAYSGGPINANGGMVVSGETGGMAVDGSGGTFDISSATGGRIITIQPTVVDDGCPSVYFDLEHLPIDIIIAVETTDGMSDKVAQLKEHLNFSFVERLREVNIDPLVIVVAAQTGNPLSEEHRCLDAPLGSGNCPYDSNLPYYCHIDRVVGENDALNQLADYFIYEPYLLIGPIVQLSDTHNRRPTHRTRIC